MVGIGMNLGFTVAAAVMVIKRCPFDGGGRELNK